MKYFVHTILLCLLLPCGLKAQEPQKKEPFINFQGYIKELQGLTYAGPENPASYLNIFHNRVNLKARWGKGWSARLEVRNRLLSGNSLSQIPDPGKYIDSYNGLAKLSALWINKPGIVAHSVIDRLLIQYESDTWVIRAGRQRINWGISNTWNPNDIFNAFNFLDFDYEERPGNDAIRVTRHLKNEASLELAWKPGKNKEDHIAALLYRWNAQRYDFQVLAGRSLTDWMAGGGWAGSIGQSGFKGELSYFQPAKNITDTTGVLTATVMADRSFPHEWYASLSALYISSADTTENNSANLINSQLSAKKLFPYRFSIAGTVSKQLNPVRTLQCTIVYSPSRNDFILFPSVSWNLLTNFDLDLTGQGFAAARKKTRLVQAGAIYLRGKWSF